MSTEFTNLYNSSNLYANGCKALFESSKSVRIFPGILRDKQNVFDIVVDTSIPLNASFNGAGGLDVGVLQNSKTYYVYVIADPTGALPTSSLMSLSPTVPVLPTVNGFSYSYYRMVDMVSTNESGNFIDFVTVGDGMSRFKQFSDPQQVLLDGASTFFQNVQMQNILPSSNLKNAELDIIISSTTSGAKADIQIFSGASSFTSIESVANVKISKIATIAPFILNTDVFVSYQVVSPAKLSLYVLGYNFYI